MPLVPNHPNEMETDVEAPTQPHLALLTNDNDTPAFIALAGAILAIVIDPKDPIRGIFPITPTFISAKRMVFRCPCGQKACDRRVTFHGTWSGLHPKGTPEISTK